MKINFYISLKKIKEVDLSRPYQGNPGIGATEYLFILLLTYMTEKNELDVTLLTDCDTIKIPSIIKVKKVENEFAALDYADENSDVIVLKSNFSDNLNEYILTKNISVITWAHNRITDKMASYIKNNKNIKVNVCVGENQALEIYDHTAFKKIKVIFNPIYMQKSKNTIQKKQVVYMGHLSKSRGVHVLLNSWIKVSKNHPEYELKIIGSGKLYDRNQVLGPYGLSDQKYEKKIMKLVKKIEKRDVRKVNFIGIVGEEKNEIFSESRIGIVNPFGYETLGLSGIEMSALGLPVITLNKYGQSEIVKNNETGFLIKNHRQLTTRILKIIENDYLYERFSKNSKIFIENKFSIELVYEEWKNLFINELNGNMKNNITIKVGLLTFLYTKVRNLIPFFPSKVEIKYKIKKIIIRMWKR